MTVSANEWPSFSHMTLAMCFSGAKMEGSKVDLPQFSLFWLQLLHYLG